MASVSRQTQFDAPASDIWARIGDFHDISWLPAVESQTADGDVRTLNLVGGGTVVETLLDETDSSYTYRIDESGMPVADYTATIAVEEANNGCLVTWSAEFRAVGASDEEAETLINGIFDDGLSAI